MKLLLPAVAALVLITAPAFAADTAKSAKSERPRSSVPATAVPGQPVRPEGNDEATVPKTPMDRDAPETGDVGANKMAESPKPDPKAKHDAASPAH